jgi:hypothetical protein
MGVNATTGEPLKQIRIPPEYAYAGDTLPQDITSLPVRWGDGEWRSPPDCAIWLPTSQFTGALPRLSFRSQVAPSGDIWGILVRFHNLSNFL